MILGIDYGSRTILFSRWEESSDYTVNKTGATEMGHFDDLSISTR